MGAGSAYNSRMSKLLLTDASFQFSAVTVGKNDAQTVEKNDVQNLLHMSRPSASNKTCSAEIIMIYDKLPGVICY